jgi:3-oxoacyl-[acyl-carrier protein] reductase
MQFSNLHNKRILITGATGSIGAALIKVLDKEKPRKLILLGRNKNKLNNIKLESRHSFYTIDLEDSSSIFTCLHSIKEEIDVIIFAHGCLIQSKFLNSTDVDTELQVNYLSVQQITRFFCRKWVGNNKDKHICVISSLAANVPSPTMSSYSASKAALTAWSKAVSIELESNSIYLKQVIVGLVKDTNMTSNIDLFNNVPSYSLEFVANNIKNILLDKANYHVIGLLVNMADRMSNLSPALMNVISRFNAPY